MKLNYARVLQNIKDLDDTGTKNKSGNLFICENTSEFLFQEGVCACGCVRACVRACECACVRACVCVRAAVVVVAVVVEIQELTRVRCILLRMNKRA